MWGSINIICTFDMWIVHDTFVLYVETLVFPHLYYSDDRGGHEGGGIRVAVFSENLTSFSLFHKFEGVGTGTVDR